jgi:uncharacterized membrane protein
MLRFLRHLFLPAWLLRRRFPPALLAEIEAAVVEVERRHAGEVRFVLEHALEPGDLLAGLTPRERALQVFGLARVWDTAANNGVLVYVLYAEHAVEIVADRGIAARVPQADWDAVCRLVETHFRESRFREGALAAVHGVAALLARHFPHAPGDPDELPNQPLLL